jgi:acetylglutamate kinase
VRDVPPQIRERTIAKARTLIEALPFIQEHRGKVVVLKYGGAAMERAPLARPFALDVALLLHSGILPVIVHGGGPQVTEVSARLGIETTFIDGLRVTDAATLDVATMVLAGKLNTDVVANLLAAGVPAVGLSGVDGGLLMARRRTAPDLGFVGDVVSVNAGVARTLMDREFVPVIASIAMDEAGQAYNVNADVVAAELSIALEAEKLVFLNDVPGVIGAAGDLLSELGASEVVDLLAQDGAVEGGMIPKLESAVRALGAGVRRVHLLDGRVEHGLVLELFTPEGVGTMIAPDVPHASHPSSAAGDGARGAGPLGADPPTLPARSMR